MPEHRHHWFLGWFLTPQGTYDGYMLFLVMIAFVVFVVPHLAALNITALSVLGLYDEFPSRLGIALLAALNLVLAAGAYVVNRRKLRERWHWIDETLAAQEAQRQLHLRTWGGAAAR